MSVGKWSIAGTVATVVSVIALIAVRPELADNATLWTSLLPVITSLIAAAKAEKSAEEVSKVRTELKNGVITKVVKDAMDQHKAESDES